LSQEQQAQLQKELLPALSGLVRCFFVMKWLGLQLLPPSGEQTDQLAAFAGLDLGGRPTMRQRDVSEFDYHVVQVYYRELLPVRLLADTPVLVAELILRRFICRSSLLSMAGCILCCNKARPCGTRSSRSSAC
jgi:hypothetical protein